MNHTAIYALYPQVVTVDDSAGAFDKDGNTVEIDLAAVEAWRDPNQYKYQRAAAYPSIPEQLDLLWHAMDEGSIPGNKTAWYTAIQSVKTQFPKS